MWGKPKTINIMRDERTPLKKKSPELDRKTVSLTVAADGLPGKSIPYCITAFEFSWCWTNLSSFIVHSLQNQEVEKQKVIFMYK